MTSTKSGLPARNQFLSRVRRLSHHIFCGRIQTVHKRWCSGSTFPKDFPPSSPKVAHYGFSSLSRSSFPEPPSGILMNSIFSLRTDPFAWASCPYRCLCRPCGNGNDFHGDLLRKLSCRNHISEFHAAPDACRQPQIRCGRLVPVGYGRQ